jgi:beta-phosphoglucomutase-like phosphatase (HAD superfamily)
MADIFDVARNSPLSGRNVENFETCTLGPKERFWRGPNSQGIIPIPEGVDTWVLDFDHTIGLTEFLHRASFRETAWRSIEQSVRETNEFRSAESAQAQLELLRPLRAEFDAAWVSNGFQRAFGKPERVSCEIVADCLKNSFGIDEDPDRIRLRRFKTIAHAKKKMDGNGDLEAISQNSEVSMCRVNDIIRAIQRAQPIKGLVQALKSADEIGIKIGLCTGSSSEFVAEILSAFDLDEVIPPRFRVFANHYDPSRGKPDPHPFLVTFEQMELKAQHVSGRPHYPNVLVFEDSISGLTSALGAGAHVAFSPGRAYGPTVSFVHEAYHNLPVHHHPIAKREQNLKLQLAIAHAKDCKTEMLLMSPGKGWTQLMLTD